MCVSLNLSGIVWGLLHLPGRGSLFDQGLKRNSTRSYSGNLVCVLMFFFLDCSSQAVVCCVTTRRPNAEIVQCFTLSKLFYLYSICCLIIFLLYDICSLCSMATSMDFFFELSLTTSKGSFKAFKCV